MGLKGDLSTLALTEVFQLITSSGKEGTLVVHDEKSRREKASGFFQPVNEKGIPWASYWLRKRLSRRPSFPRP